MQCAQACLQSCIQHHPLLFDLRCFVSFVLLCFYNNLSLACPVHSCHQNLDESWLWTAPPRLSNHSTGFTCPTLHVCFATSFLQSGHGLMFEQVMSPMRGCTFWSHVYCSNISTKAASPFPRNPEHAIHGSETQMVGQTNAETSRQDRCGCATLRTDSTQPIHFCGD